MSLSESLPQFPEAVFFATGEAFFSALLPHFHQVFASRQLLILQSRPAPSGALEVVFAAGFAPGFVAPAHCFAAGLPALNGQVETSWIWPAAACELCADDPMLMATGAESFLGVCLHDESGGLMGYLLLYGPACQSSPAHLRQLNWVAGRTAGELSRLKREDRLLGQARLHQTVLNAIPMPIFFKDTEGKYLGCNESFARFLKKSRQEIIGEEVYGVAPKDLADKYRQADLELLATGGEQVYESAVLNGDGERRQVVFHKAVFYDDAGNKAGISGTLVDVTSLRAAENEAHYYAHFDQVTGLPNQILLRDRLEQELLYAQHGGYELAVLCLDLDSFKKINNAYGHDFGDRILACISRRMRDALDCEDTIARLGGDSFIVLAPLRSGQRSARSIAALLLEEVGRPIELDERRIYLSASIGIALYPRDSRQACVLLSQADAAQAIAKEKKQGDMRFFTRTMNTEVAEQLLLEGQLRRALDEQQFFLLYQPQVDAVSGQIVGAEALLRWQHPEWGLVMPDRFIPLAEQTRLIRQVGEVALEQACRQARIWQDAGIENLRVAVNISPMQFQDRDLVERVGQILQRTGLEPHRLGLEITETEVMRDFDHAIDCLARFRDLGLHLAVDDFGTGYSSLSYLKYFPIDQLKIDRTFIEELPGCEDDAAIVTAIVALGKSLGLKVMAEGVETAAQEAFLAKLGCVAFQGYHFGRPLTAEAFDRLLRVPARAVHA